MMCDKRKKEKANRITQDMRFEQAVIAYFFKKGSQRQPSTTRPAARTSTAGVPSAAAHFNPLPTALTDLTATQISTQRRRQAGQGYAPQKPIRGPRGVLSQAPAARLHQIYLRFVPYSALY